jgi:hypothetical protein
LTAAFNDQFPELIKDRQGFSYERNEQLIAKFEAWLRSMGYSGPCGSPRDLPPQPSGTYLVQIDPEERWVSLSRPLPGSTRPAGKTCSGNLQSVESAAKPRKKRGGCS